MRSSVATQDRPDTASIGNHQRPMDVLYVIDSLPLGGAESQVITLASTLHGSGHNVRVCCLRHEGVQARILQDSGVQVTALNMRLRYWPVALYRLYRLIRQLRPQVVHTHLYQADFWGRLVAELAGVPVIVNTLHGNFYWRSHGLRAFMDRFINRFTDKTIAVSEQIRQGFVDTARVPQEKVTIIPNAVDIERFHREDSRPKIRMELGIDLSVPVIGTVARLSAEKRLDCLLQAAQTTCEAVPQARFLVIGDGPQRDELISLAKQLNFETGRVTFLGARFDIPELLSALDVFVISSDTEGLPVSLLEAMAAARAVVATRVGGIPQLIDSGRNGLLVPPHDPASLAKAILTLVTDDSLYDALAREARRTIETRYSASIVGQQIVALYQGLMEAKGHGHVT